jgi:hypothetical protein
LTDPQAREDAQKRVVVIDVVAACFCIVVGLAIAYVDSRPTWDDSGITVGALLVAAAFAGFAVPYRAWRWGLLLGIWTPVIEIVLYGSIGAFAAPVFGVLAALVGSALRHFFHASGEPA